MDAVMVFTSKSTEQIISDGGSGNWNITPSKVVNMRYAVCTFCDTPKEDTMEAVTGRGPRGMAFLVGKISGVRASRFHNGRQRYVIEFSEFAEIDVADVWDHSRNPVRYVDESYFENLGIDFGKLAFKPMPHKAKSDGDSSGEVKALQLEEAREGLALTLGVRPAQIQFVITA